MNREEMKLEESTKKSCQLAFDLGRVQGITEASKWLHSQHYDFLSLLVLKLAEKLYQLIMEEKDLETSTPDTEAIDVCGDCQEVESGACSSCDSAGARPDG
jgi:hypothetical protein